MAYDSIAMMIIVKVTKLYKIVSGENLLAVVWHTWHDIVLWTFMKAKIPSQKKAMRWAFSWSLVFWNSTT